MQITDCSAYEILQKERIEDVHADGYLLRHKKSGARVMLLANQDENKVFNNKHLIYCHFSIYPFVFLRLLSFTSFIIKYNIKHS